MPDPTRLYCSSFWHLDYGFTPTRLKIGDQPWTDRELHVGYLIPRYKPWREAPPRGQSIPPHRCVLDFMVLRALNYDQMFCHSSPFEHTRFLDPDGILATTMTSIAATARALADDSYWTVHGMVADLLQILTGAAEIRPGIREIRAAALKRPVESIVTRALAYLQEHMADPVAVRDVARRFGMADSTLSHHFKKAGVSSPMKELQRLRILRVKALLMLGWKLDAIAQATGFCDGLYLSRIFKQVEGMPPSAFVRKFGHPKSEAASAVVLARP